MQFDGYINISAIDSLESIKKKEFRISVRNVNHVKITNKKSTKQNKVLLTEKDKEYIFRCPNQESRDKWFTKINKCIEYSTRGALVQLNEAGFD